MSRICPGCGTDIPSVGGLKELREKGGVWYRRWRRRFHCKKCGQQLRVVITPVGYWLTAAILLLLLACAYLRWFPPTSLYWRAGTALGLAAAFVVLVKCFEVWGMHFVLATHAPEGLRSPPQ